ncbi:hypothetical protein BY458DRAFT_551733 [Sporodiniella umbellata]|nr:hypothetical protein BY458DRAFT_551733 [Sporodiniella umbellata]
MRKAFNKKSSRIGIPIEIPVAPITPTERYNKRPKRKSLDRKEEDAREEERVKKIRSLFYNNGDAVSSLIVEDKHKSFTKPRPRRFEHLGLLGTTREEPKTVSVLDLDYIDTDKAKKKRREDLEAIDQDNPDTRTKKRVRQLPSFSDGEDELDADEYLHEPKATSSVSLLSKMKPKVLSLLSSEAKSVEKQTDFKKVDRQPGPSRTIKSFDWKERLKRSVTDRNESDKNSRQSEIRVTEDIDTATTEKGNHHTSGEELSSGLKGWFRSREKSLLRRETKDTDKIKKNKSPPKDPILKKEQFSFFDSDKHILMYPFSGPRQHTVLWGDAERLKEDRYLNDTIIDLYPRIWNEQYPTNKIHAFSSFFFAKLKDCHTDNDFKLLSKWTKGTNLFEKDLLIIPIAENHHWFLALILNPGACVQTRSDDTEKHTSGHLNRHKSYIIVVDSLGGKQRHVRKSLTNYLSREAQEKLGVAKDDFSAPEFVSISSPLQDNYYDCGVYSLYTMHSLYKKTDKMFTSIYEKKSIIDDDEEMQQLKLKNYRRTLSKLLTEKAKEYATFKSRSL